MSVDLATFGWGLRPPPDPHHTVGWMAQLRSGSEHAVVERLHMSTWLQVSGKNCG